MTADPCEVMAQLVEQEACTIKAAEDLDLLDDARSIAEAEQQRTGLRDRFDAALGMPVVIRSTDATFIGLVDEVGPEFFVLRQDSQLILIRQSAIIDIEGLPRALRREEPVRAPLPATLATVLRRWACGGSVTICLTDLRRVRGCIESVGADHLELRAEEGSITCVAFIGISAVLSPQ